MISCVWMSNCQFSISIKIHEMRLQLNEQGKEITKEKSGMNESSFDIGHYCGYLVCVWLLRAGFTMCKIFQLVTINVKTARQRLKPQAALWPLFPNS